jgi:hypothetical protein
VRPDHPAAGLKIPKKRPKKAFFKHQNELQANEDERKQLLI